jgi:ribosome maturation factor RimP
MYEWARGAHFFLVLIHAGLYTRGRLSIACNPMDNRELEIIITRELEALGFECVKLEVVGSSRNPIVRLYIDKPGGVGIKHCASVSRALGLVLEETDPFPGRYLLEVSSPGNNRPLTKEEHFVRFAGQEARVHFVDAESGKKTCTGHIRSCINGLLVLDTEDGELQIGLSNIVKANLHGQEYKIDKKRNKIKRKKDGRK